MKNLFKVTLLALTLVATAHADAELDKLQGKWEVKKTSPGGDKYTQVIEIKKDRMVFTIRTEDNEVRFFAKGDVKAEKSGPFSVLKISNIEWGSSESDTQPANDDRASVYQLNYGSLTLVSNMDKQRDNQEPSLDVYSKSSK